MLEVRWEIDGEVGYSNPTKFSCLYAITGSKDNWWREDMGKAIEKYHDTLILLMLAGF